MFIVFHHACIPSQIGNIPLLFFLNKSLINTVFKAKLAYVIYFCHQEALYLVCRFTLLYCIICTLSPMFNLTNNSNSSTAAYNNNCGISSNWYWVLVVVAEQYTSIVLNLLLVDRRQEIKTNNNNNDLILIFVTTDNT